MQIIVLGMHRSGTSITTRLINMMGGYFGPETSIGEINSNNPKGFWERPEVFKLNESLLAMKGCSWSDLGHWKSEYAHSISNNLLITIKKMVLGMDAFRPWVLKDPRLCLTLPAWRAALEVPIAVIVHRDPLEIALSLQKRDGFPLEKSIGLWQRYSEGIIANTQDIPRIYVQHKDLLQDPVETCRAIYQQLVEQGVRRIEMPTPKEITAFVEPRLYRAKADQVEYQLTPEQQTLVGKMTGTIQ